MLIQYSDITGTPSKMGCVTLPTMCRIQLSFTCEIQLPRETTEQNVDNLVLSTINLKMACVAIHTHMYICLKGYELSPERHVGLTYLQLLTWLHT